jgi:YidC/Oxa1 family membrane protein insertase
MSFNRTQTGIGRLGLSVEENSQLGNYVFSAADVRNFLDANFFGAPLGATMIQQHGLEAFGPDFNRVAVIAVGVPVMLLAGFATHMNSRASVARQSPEAAANPQTAIMNRLALWIFPLGVIVGGPFLPLAIILYWFANNIWTFGQQHYVFGKIEKEEKEKKQEAIARRAANAPAPGAKPSRPPKKPAGVPDSPEITESSGTEVADGDGQGTAGEKTKPNAGGSNGGGSVGRTPRPGARPKKRKR